VNNQELVAHLNQDLENCLAMAERERKDAKAHQDKADYWAEQAKCVRAVMHRYRTTPIVVNESSEK
jgi:hypothetical protein